MTQQGFLDHATNFGYGEAWERWPVEPGVEWRVGRHRLICLDMETPAAADWWRDQQLQVFYSDPPWDQGNAQAFRTKAGSDRRAAYTALMGAIADVAARADQAVFVELGVNKTAPWDAAAAARGIPFARLHHVLYDKPPRPSLVWQGGALPVGVQLEGQTGDEVVRRALFPWSDSGATVADTCCGLGMTARICHKLGLRFVGSELHPRRLANTIDWLARATGETPTVV